MSTRPRGRPARGEGHSPRHPAEDWRGEAGQAQEIMRLDRLHEGDVVYFPAYLPYSCRALEQNLLGSAPILIKAIE